MAVNKVILVGNVGKDPEVHFIEANVAVARFPFATSETYRSKDGERITTTEWHNVVLWRGLAEVADKYVKKGSQLYIEGKIRTRSYDDRDGNKRYITEIIADNMQMLGRRSDSGSEENGSSEGTMNEQGSDRPSTAGSSSQQEPSASDLKEPFVPGGEDSDDLPF